MLLQGRRTGFVRVLDQRTIAFPVYDGNGMFLSLGNLTVNPRVGILFVNFEVGTRLRLNGTASIDPEDPLIRAYPGAQLVVRVEARAVFSNCRRYVHRYRRVGSSEFVPSGRSEPPVPTGSGTSGSPEPCRPTILPTTPIAPAPRPSPSSAKPAPSGERRAGRTSRRWTRGRTRSRGVHFWEPRLLVKEAPDEGRKYPARQRQRGGNRRP